jgi:phosphoglycolate phosphatase-like HAD superfamily hydrolase
VVGVDRVGQAEQLKQHGADIVVKDVAELLGQDASSGQDAR